MSKSFQIIFNEADGQRYSATFDVAIPLECKGKFVDIKGKVYDMRKYHRTLDSESTSLNIIHNAKNLDDNCICKNPDQCGEPDGCEDINDQCALNGGHCHYNGSGCICADGWKECRAKSLCGGMKQCPHGMKCYYPSGHHCKHFPCGYCECRVPSAPGVLSGAGQRLV